MKVDRRSFLSFVIGGAAGTTLSPLPWKLMDDSSIWSQMWPWKPVPPAGEVVYEDSTCPLCPGGCGITVRKVENRAVKIEGKAGHPINNGGICLLGLSGLQLLYGPTRIKSPMKRVGERGEGKWERISWQEAMTLLSEKLGEIRDKGEAHTVAAISGTGYGTVTELLKRFMTAYGSPNFFRSPSMQDTDEFALNAIFRSKGRLGYDLENADYILSFGSGILDGWGSPVRMFRANSLWKDNQVPVIQVEPRLSNSAGKASKWVAINPGTEADLALGIAALLISQKMANKGNISGFRAWKNELVQAYKPETVAETTGVPVETISELAQGFGTAKRPIALYGKGKGVGTGSLREIAAVTVLNALSGNLNKEGGLWAVSQPDFINWPNVNTDQIADAGLNQSRIDGAGDGPTAGIESVLTRLPQKVLEDGPYPIQALLVAGANPCHELPDTKSVKQALGKIPFIVSFSSFHDETADQADLLMPDHVYLEKFEDVTVGAGLVKEVIGLCRPVVSAQFNTKHLGETLIATANMMGDAIAGAFPWENYESCLKETLGNKWDSMIENGYWENGDVDTAAKKVRPAALDAPVVQAQGDVNSFPLLLVPYDTIRISSGYVGDTPFMVKTVSDTTIKGKDGFVEINPQTAAANGLTEGTLATLATPVGEASVRVHLFEGIKPGVIAMARGLGHTAYDGYLADKGVNVNELIGPVEDPSSGLDAAWGIRAKLDKA